MKAADLVGQKFGLLTVTSRGPNTKGGKTTWWCACDCGKQTEKAVNSANLKSGHTTTCGCSKVSVSVGQKFGKLTVISQGPKDKQDMFTWWCACDCGKQNEKAIKSSSLNSGHTTSCGCVNIAALQRSNDKKRVLAASTFVAKAQAVHGVDAYDYSKVEYVGSYDNVEIGCNTCGEYFPQRQGSHLSGSGCPSCANYSFNQTEPATLYYALLNLADGSVAYMIGITNRTFEKRYSFSDRKHMTLMESRWFPVGADALALETQLKQDHKHDLYLGDMPIKKGNTEVYSIDINPFNQPRQEAA